MKIDKYTLYKDFASVESLAPASQLFALRDVAVRDKFGEAGFYQLSIGDFLDAAIYNKYDALFDCRGETVFDRYRILAFSVWLDEFISAAEGLTLKPTPKQIAASSGCRPVTFEESVYFFMREYFGLSSFDAVRDLTVSDYLLAKKDTYNKQVVERALLNRVKNDNN